MHTTTLLFDRTRGLLRLCFGLSFGVLVLLSNADRAHACACCADAGFRFEAAGPLEAEERDLLEGLRFEDKATLASREFDVEGLPLPSYDAPDNFYGYHLETVFETDHWTLTLSEKGGKRATIKFPMPETLDHFHIDPRDGAMHQGAGGPLLYKEWRLVGPATLGSTDAGDNITVQARLILHGRGNACSNEGDFGHWTLSVEGEGVRFTLIGDLAG